MYTCKICKKDIVGTAYIPPCKNIVHFSCIDNSDFVCRHEKDKCEKTKCCFNYKCCV